MSRIKCKTRSFGVCLTYHGCACNPALLPLSPCHGERGHGGRGEHHTSTGLKDGSATGRWWPNTVVSVTCPKWSCRERAMACPDITPWGRVRKCWETCTLPRQRLCFHYVLCNNKYKPGLKRAAEEISVGKGSSLQKKNGWDVISSRKQGNSAPPKPCS